MTRTEQAHSSAAVGRLPEAIRTIIAVIQDKKATDVVVLDLRRTHGFTDYFVLCSGGNQRQIKAVADGVEATLKEMHRRPSHIEGYERAEWILIDGFDFIVHIFNPETRAFYALERLWGSAERIDVPQPERPADPARR